MPAHITERGGAIYVVQRHTPSEDRSSPASLYLLVPKHTASQVALETTQCTLYRRYGREWPGSHDRPRLFVWSFANGGDGAQTGLLGTIELDHPRRTHVRLDLPEPTGRHSLLRRAFPVAPGRSSNS